MYTCTYLMPTPQHLINGCMWAVLPAEHATTQTRKYLLLLFVHVLKCDSHRRTIYTHTRGEKNQLTLQKSLCWLRWSTKGTIISFNFELYCVRDVKFWMINGAVRASASFSKWWHWGNYRHMINLRVVKEMKGFWELQFQFIVEIINHKKH